MSKINKDALKELLKSTYVNGVSVVQSEAYQQILIDNVYNDSVNTNLITEVADLGTPVGGFYELVAGAYIFACGLTLDFPIKLITVNGDYTLVGSNINCLLIYSGSGSMIQTDATGIVLLIENLVLNSPNAEAITFNSGNSLLLTNISLGFGCQKVATVTNTAFFTCDGFAMVSCDDGVSCVNVDSLSITNTQWTSGTDSNGTAFSIDGTGTQALFTIINYHAEATENMIDIDNSYTGTVNISNGSFINNGGSFFDITGKDGTNPGVNVQNVARVPNSSTTTEAVLRDNGVLTTDIPTINALVLANSSSWIGQNESRLTVGSDGVVINNTVEDISIRWDGGVEIEPIAATKQLVVRFIKIGIENITVSFTNGTNVVDEIGTSLSNGDTIIFYNSSGALPAELRKDITYYVVNKLTDSFQLSYTEGGVAVSFTDDGTPTNTYDLASLNEGSEFTEPIAANSPRTIIVKSNLPMSEGEKVGIFIQNKDDSTNVELNSGYFRS